MVKLVGGAMVMVVLGLLAYGLTMKLKKKK